MFACALKNDHCYIRKGRKEEKGEEGNAEESCHTPRPFPPPVFDCILYVKTEGEGLGERVTCVMSGRHEGRREGGRDRSL